MLRLAATAENIRDVNVRYHDLCAHDYDAKWGIDYGESGQAQVIGKLQKVLGERPGPYARSLEIGAGTGYFTLNLLRAGVIGEAVATDISPGMLEALSGSAERLGLDLTGVTGTLVEEGVASFVKAFDDLLGSIAKKQPATA